MDDDAYPDDGGAASTDDMDKLGRKWLTRIREALAREEAWRRDAEAAEKAYSCDAESDAPGKLYDFNILHSNVETIVPSLYNSTPAPDIRERFRVGSSDRNGSVARLVAQLFERGIAVQIDDGRLDGEMEAVVQDAFLAGRGVLRLRFDADESVDPMTSQLVVSNERVRFEAVSWRDYCEGPAQRWDQVPWVAFRYSVSEEEMERISDPEMRDKLAKGKDPKDRPVFEQSRDEDAYIWEIWCRESRRVKLLVEHSGEIISMQDDPLQLPGFFPMPAPVQPIGVTGKRGPVCPFAVYRKLADELETITRRIKAIATGLKVRGIVLSDAASVEALAQADDNTLVPISDITGMAQMGGLDRAITWWPVETAIAVLRELYSLREGVKQAIYEITGISDIIRGQGDKGETATAQQIKTQWGSLRIKRLQRLVERAVREVFILTTEIMSRHFSVQTLQMMSGIQVPPDAVQMLNSPLDHYRIDVESDSTVRADLTQRREEMARFLEGSAQFIGTMAPLVQQSPEMAQPIAEIYASFARQFRLGKQAEDAIEQMAQGAAQAAQQPSPERQAQQAQAQAEQAKVQLEGQKMQAETQIKAVELQIKQAELRLKEMELQLKAREIQMRGAEAAMSFQERAQERAMGAQMVAQGVR